MRTRSFALRVAIPLVLGMSYWGCQASTPGPPTTPSPRSALTLSGIIFETTQNGPRPIESGTLEYSVDDPGPTAVNGRSIQWNDASGRYSIDVPAGAHVRVIAFAKDFSKFSQVCAANTVMTKGATLDVELVRSGQAVSNRRSPTLSGIIFRTAAGGGRHSYANSFVEYKSIGFQFLRDAYTTTDADGHFEFCNLSLGRGSLSVGDCNEGSNSWGSPVDLSGDTVIDLDLTPFI